MNVLAWILQVVLALAFVGAGAMKLSTPKEKLRERMAWVEGFQPGQIKAIGAAEVLGALGLILPAVTKIAPVLTPLAALGLFLTMVGAVITHVRLKEAVSQYIPALALGLLSLVVAIIRFGPATL